MSIFDLTLLGLTEAQLLSIRDTALGNIASGKVVSSISAPGLTTTFQINSTPVEVAKAATFALQQMNPSRYGQALITSTIGYLN